MNRQIEFKGKNLENEWVYGYLYIHEPPLTVFESQDESKRKYYIIQTGIADWNMDRPKYGTRLIQKLLVSLLDSLT